MKIKIIPSIILFINNKSAQSAIQTKQNTISKPTKAFQQAGAQDDDIQFFDDQNNFFQEDRQKSNTLHKFERKMDFKSSTTVDFNRSTQRKQDEFDELLGGLDNKSNMKPSSSNYSNKNMQGQYNQSQNYFQELNDEMDDDMQKKSQMGMTGMTLQTTVSKNEDFHPRQFGQALNQPSNQQNDNIRKSQQDLGYFENKNDDLDLDVGFSRRNLRRSETYKGNEDDKNQVNSNLFGKPPLQGSMLLQTNSIITRNQDPSLSMPPAFKNKDSGFPNSRQKQKDDEYYLSVPEEDEETKYKQEQQFNKGMSFGGAPPKTQSNYPFAGGIFDTNSQNPQHHRVKSSNDFNQSDGQKGQQSYSKKGTLQHNDLDDVLEDCDYNPSSTSRLVASKRPRTGQRENQSQPTSMNNTISNINIPQQQKQQVYPRLMKSPEESQHTNINNMQNESIGLQQKYARSQGNKNESSFMSDKDLLGASETKEGPQQFEDNINLDNKFSRRSSYMRGENANKNIISNSQNQPHSAFFQPNNQNQGALSDINDLKMSETNFQQNQIFNAGSNYGSEKAAADPKQQYRQNQEDLSLKVLKQMEEERKTMRTQITQEHDETIKKMKNNYEDQIKSIKDNYETHLKFEKDRNQQLQDEIKEIIIKDRERQRSLFEIEIQNLKEQFEKEKGQINITHSIQSDSLKKQLQQQAELIGLAEQLKQNSEKLNVISFQIENTSEKNQIDMQKLNHEVQEKQKYLKDMESRLKLETEFIDAEKKRISKMKSDLASTEENQTSYLEKEKSLIRTEYQRLTELQDQIKELDIEKRREFIHEKNKLESDRIELQEERIQLKEEFERMYKDFELKVAIFESTKSELEKGQSKIENRQQQQLKEIEQKKYDLLKQEQLIVQKQKMLELKDYELKQQESDYAQIFREVKADKIYCDNEKKGIKALADKVDSENNYIRDFKANFDMERMKLAQKEQELQEKEKNIRRQQDKVLTEKREVQQLQDTLRSVKSHFIKELVNSPPTSLSLAPSFQSFLSPNKQAGSAAAPPNQFSFRSPQNYQSLKSPMNPNLSFQSPTYENKGSNLKDMEREIAFNEEQKKNGYSKQIMHKKFDLRGFMNQIQEVDQKQRDNIAYIMNEKDNLHSNRAKDRFPTFSYNDDRQELGFNAYNQQSERSINADSYIEN